MYKDYTFNPLYMNMNPSPNLLLIAITLSRDYVDDLGINVWRSFVQNIDVVIQPYLESMNTWDSNFWTGIRGCWNKFKENLLWWLMNGKSIQFLTDACVLGFGAFTGEYAG